MVGNPASNRFTHAEYQVRKRRIDACLQNCQTSRSHQIIGQPVHQEIPVIIEAEKTEADAEEISIHYQCGERMPKSRRSRASCVTPLKSPGRDFEPGDKP